MEENNSEIVQNNEHIGFDNELITSEQTDVAPLGVEENIVQEDQNWEITENPFEEVPTEEAPYMSNDYQVTDINNPVEYTQPEEVYVENEAPIDNYTNQEYVDMPVYEENNETTDMISKLEVEPTMHDEIGYIPEEQVQEEIYQEEPGVNQDVFFNPNDNMEYVDNYQEQQIENNFEEQTAYEEPVYQDDFANQNVELQEEQPFIPNEEPVYSEEVNVEPNIEYQDPSYNLEPQDEFVQEQPISSGEEIYNGEYSELSPQEEYQEFPEQQEQMVDPNLPVMEEYESQNMEVENAPLMQYSEEMALEQPVEYQNVSYDMEEPVEEIHNNELVEEPYQEEYVEQPIEEDNSNYIPVEEQPIIEEINPELTIDDNINQEVIEEMPIVDSYDINANPEEELIDETIQNSEQELLNEKIPEESFEENEIPAEEINEEIVPQQEESKQEVINEEVADEQPEENEVSIEEATEEQPQQDVSEQELLNEEIPEESVEGNEEPVEEITEEKTQQEGKEITEEKVEEAKEELEDKATIEEEKKETKKEEPKENKEPVIYDKFGSDFNDNLSFDNSFDSSFQSFDSFNSFN